MPTYYRLGPKITSASRQRDHVARIRVQKSRSRGRNGGRAVTASARRPGVGVRCDNFDSNVRTYLEEDTNALEKGTNRGNQGEENRNHGISPSLRAPAVARHCKLLISRHGRVMATDRPNRRPQATGRFRESVTFRIIIFCDAYCLGMDETRSSRQCERAPRNGRGWECSAYNADLRNHRIARISGPASVMT
jgi:hypothetical protein